MALKIAAVFAALLLTMSAADPLSNPAESTGAIRALLKKGKSDEARELAERACERFPNNAGVQAALADVHFRLAEFDAAEAAYRRALGEDVNCARAHYGMGRLLEASSRWRSARMAYDKARKLDASDLDILRAWATGRRAASEEISGLEHYWDSATEEDFWLRERSWSRLEWRRMVGDRNTFVASGPQSTHRIAIARVRTPELQGYPTLTVIFDSGKSVRLVLDSCMFGVVLKPHAAKRVGLKPRAVGRSVDDPRFGGWAWADKVRIGALEFRDCPIRIKGHRVLEDADGTIGTDIFRMFLIKLDFPRRQVQLSPLPSFRSAAGVPAHLPSWPNEDAPQGLSPSSAVSFLNVADNLMIPVFAGNRACGYFLFEPRLGSNVLTTRLATLLRLPPEPTNYFRRPIHSHYLTFGALYSCPGTVLRFGSVEQRNSVLYAHDGSLEEQRLGVRIAGHLGVPKRADFTVTINYRDAWIDFQPAH